MPELPRLREGAAACVYRVARPPRGPAVVTREEAGDEPVELARSGSWNALARALLEDALAERPGGKLARDLARFLVIDRGAERTMSGEQLEAWLATWQPPLSTIFPDRWKR
jgi:hypothetical protein